SAGGTHCEIVPVDARAIPEILHVLDGLLPQDVLVGTVPDTDRVSVPAPDGAATRTEVLRRIEPLGIELADIGLRRPSLDDVFLRLTGYSASAPDGSDPTDGGSTDGGSTNGGSTDAGPAGLPDPERAEPASAGERP